jgi:hypothetical protein
VPQGPDERDRKLKEKENIMSQPAHKIRCGVLQVTIWRNQSEKGNWYSVIPTRSYKQGDATWKETDSLGFDDLLTMAKLFDQAHTWIMHQQQADAKARKESQQPDAGEAAMPPAGHLGDNQLILGKESL